MSLSLNHGLVTPDDPETLVLSNPMHRLQSSVCWFVICLWGRVHTTATLVVKVSQWETPRATRYHFFFATKDPHRMEVKPDIQLWCDRALFKQN